MRKFLFSTVVLMGWLFGAAFTHAGSLDLDVDFSLGSEIGENVSGDEIMPFWAQVEAGYEFKSKRFTVKPYATYGHTSAADVNNGGTEFHGEFYGLGGELLFGIINVKAQVVKYAENNFESQSTSVQMLEAGFNTALRGIPFRVVGFYENARSGHLERAGLKFGYSFDII